jgi:hypothetical protein
MTSRSSFKSMDVIDWLLDSDPAIRWQVMQDLQGAAADAVAAWRARVATEGWGAELLALQGADGIWRRDGEQPDIETMRCIAQLQELGLDPHSEQARQTIGRLRDSPEWLTMLPEFYAWHGRPFFSGETEPCINGRVVAAGAYFGANVSCIVERLLGEQMADGGWNCEQESGSVRGSFDSTINVLEGLLLYERAATKASGAVVADVAKARERGEEYLVSRGLMRRESTGGLVNPDYQLFSYPTGYHYDVLRALDYFRSVGDPPDPRMDEAIELVRDRRRDDGRWNLDVLYPDHISVIYEEVGEPSRWITLRALRVLRWADK